MYTMYNMAANICFATKLMIFKCLNENFKIFKRSISEAL